MRVPASLTSRSALAVFFLTFFGLTAPAQRLEQGSKPATASVASFAEAFCSTLTGGFRVCKAHEADAEGAELLVLKGETIVNRIPASWATTAVTPDGFFAYRGDLDGDGRQEVVLVSLDGVSNGMGVTYSTAYIFDGDNVEAQGRPIAFTVQEFSDRESFVYDPAARRTEILLTYWGEYSTIEPRRQPGVYLIGKWFRYDGGRLEPVLGKPTLARRFLNSFAAERDNTWFENRRPFTWLKDPRTHKLFREPEEGPKPGSVLSGTIKSYQPGDNARVRFEADSGEVMTGVFGSADRGDTAEKPVEIKSVGLWEKRYTYPMSYSMDFDPAVYLKEFEGRRVKIETYRTQHGDEYVRVWLLDR